jgi:hypothetical protein
MAGVVPKANGPRAAHCGFHTKGDRSCRPSAPAAPTVRTDRPHRRHIWPLLVGLVLALLAALAAAVLYSVGGREDRTSFTAAGARELVVAVHAGHIELVPCRDGRMQVTTSRRWSVWAPPTGHAEAGGVLTLTGGCPPLGRLGITRCAVDERVTVPAGTRVPASTGELTATDMAAAALEAQLTRGSIVASFARPPDRISARVDAGSVRLTVPATTYAVDAAAPPNAGYVAVEVPTDPAASRRISAHISRGDIQILRR